MTTWNWPPWVKLPFTEGWSRWSLGSAFGRIGQHEPEPGQAVADGGDVLFAADPLDQLRQMLCI